MQIKINREENNTELFMIEQLKLSMSAYVPLKRKGIDSVLQLIAHTEEQLLEVKNIRKKQVNEIKDVLSKHNLTLRILK